MVGRIRIISKKATRSVGVDDNGDDHCKKMKLLHQPDEEHDDKEEGSGNGCTNDKVDDDEEEEGLAEDAKPIGEIIRVSDEGGKKKNHFTAFEFDGRHFEIEDSVLVTPEEGKLKPSVVIIKDIFQTEDGDLMVNGQRFYRPEEADKREGGTWKARDNRELFYSRFLDEVPADSVMHKCVIHFVPLGKPPPDRKVHPGFIVKKVYDLVRQRLRDLTD